MKVTVRMLRLTLAVVAIVQLILGLVFIFVPTQFGSLIGLKEAPTWVYWVFVMFGARALGFAYGMFLAMRNPWQQLGWIRAMIGVQAIDWLGTLYFVFNGAVTWLQVSTASFLPLIFIAVLTIGYPNQAQPSQAAKLTDNSGDIYSTR
jgi:hypothetical protein